MRQLRILSAGAWYLVGTAVNNREPLFWSALERARFERVLNEARKLHAFALYGLRFSGPTVSFFIKPGDGLQLPEIMQWIKQTYSVRYNVYDGRTGHIWGDRYWSVIVEGPPGDAKEYVFAPVICKAGRRRAGKRCLDCRSGVQHKGQPLHGGNGGSPPGLPRRTALPHG
jgi:hypothetical protein